MIQLLYCSVEKLPDNQVGKHMRLLPDFISTDILRYRNLSDQKSRLLGKLMLRFILKSEGADHLMHELDRDVNHKPFLKSWKPFNISHADGMVVFCSGRHSVGVDIEKIGRLEDTGLLHYFHREEQEYIIESNSPDLAFYEIWVKKEAFLKAIGIGITNGLNQCNCVKEKIHYRGLEWYLRSIHLREHYLCYLCYPEPLTEVAIVEFNHFLES